MLLSLRTVLGAETSSGAAPAASAIPSAVLPTFERFVKEKYALEETIAKKHNIEVPVGIDNFFAAVEEGDPVTISNLFHSIRTGKGKQRIRTEMGARKNFGVPPTTFLGLRDFSVKWIQSFWRFYGVDMVNSIPPGSIYFGGTDYGRFLVSAFSESHSEGRPFFTVTQNALVDSDYLGYVADMYGGKINLADTNDSRESFSKYLADAQARLRHDQEHPNEPRQVKPGEDIHVDESGRIQTSGQVSVMSINALLTKVIFDKNPAKEFYVEESFPLDWMFPNLTPSGLILKLNREPLPELTEDILRRDHEFWSKYSERLIGNWITYDTPVKDVAAFAEKVYLRHDFDGFKGDVTFARDNEAQKTFSKLRSSSAGIYSWRMGQPPSGGTMPPRYIAEGANGMLVQREADFAFKQAFAFCPYSPEAVFRYVQILVTLRRLDDALLVAQTAQKLAPENSQFTFLVSNLQEIKSRSSNVENEIVRLEKAVDANPTNFTQQFDLAQKYLQSGRNDRAYQVLDGVLANPKVTLPMVMSLADAYSRLNQLRKLEPVLEKLTQLAPDSPEAWYDLAAVRASLDQTAPALEALKKSLDFSAQRLAQKPNADDLRAKVVADPRFAKLRDTPEFKALVAPQ